MISKNTHLHKLVSFAFIFTLAISASVFSTTRYAHAQASATGISVPTDTGFDFQSIMNFKKSFTLDKAASTIAKVVLHQMTASVVNWINSGFKGSPAFLTNPEGFFLDVADQTTGAFISQNGALSKLCGPFSLDIRLSLAMQSNFNNNRYACTLSTIINNAKNASFNASVDVNVSHSTTEGFMGGDFSQGGWPAFITMTTQPQNNFMGALLQAKSDLAQQIEKKQNAIRVDVQLGSGFMSWQDCKDIPGGTIDPNDEYQLNEAEAATYGDSTVSTKDNKDGTRTYQSCETSTPGSVISGKLMKNVTSPEVQLELANDINAIVGALMNQMVSQVLSNGLHSFSAGGGGGGSGGSAAYTRQLMEEAAVTRQLIEDQNVDASKVIADLSTLKSQYDLAATAIVDSEIRFNNAKTCYTSARSNIAMLSNAGAIDLALKDIDTNLDKATSLKTAILANQSLTTTQLGKLKTAQTTMTTNPTVTAANAQTMIQAQTDLAKMMVDTRVNVITRAENASTDLGSAQTLDTAAIAAESKCNALTQNGLYSNL